MRLRLVVALAACLAIAAVGAPAAGVANGKAAAAQVTNIAPLYNLPVTGVAKNGSKFTGTYGIQRFVVRRGKVVSVGTLKGRLRGRRVSRNNVIMPAGLTGASGARAAQATCPVLHLVLGPINLNLLGLQVKLGGGTQANQEIVLDITAQQGGGLLGDLLCGVSNLLNPTGVLGQLNGQLQQLSATLNSLLSLLGGLQATRP
jgi:hypothetical protein